MRSSARRGVASWSDSPLGGTLASRSSDSQEKFRYGSLVLIAGDYQRSLGSCPYEHNVAMPWNGQPSVGDSHGAHVGTYLCNAVADPTPAPRSQHGLVASIANAAVTTAVDDLRRCASSPAAPRMSRQDGRSLVQEIVADVDTPASKVRPRPLAEGEYMYLMPDTADTAPGKHRRCQIAGDVNRHRSKAPSTGQPMNGIQPTRFDRRNTLGENVVSHWITWYVAEGALWRRPRSSVKAIVAG